MDNMAIERILIEAGAHVRPLEDESHRPEIVNVLLAKPEAITGQTIPEMIAPAWPEKPYMEVAARLSRAPVGQHVGGHRRVSPGRRLALAGHGWTAVVPART